MIYKRTLDGGYLRVSSNRGYLWYEEPKSHEEALQVAAMVESRVFPPISGLSPQHLLEVLRDER